MKFKILPRNLRKQTNNILNKNERLATNLVDDKPSSVFDKSFRHLTTFNSGYLTPIFCDEVYPGDIMKIDTSTLIRLSTPAAATMENPVYDIAFYFVPYRILWDNFKVLMGENKSAGYQKSITRAPIIDYISGTPGITETKYNENDLASYLGFPINKSFFTADMTINALWFKAYGKIWNDYYRDQNLQSEIDITNNNNNDADVKYKDYYKSSYNKSIQVGKGLAPVSRLADYFSTCLPWAQKGEPITIDTLPLKNLQVNLKKPLIVDNAQPSSYDGFTPLIYNSEGLPLLRNQTLATGATSSLSSYNSPSVSDFKTDVKLRLAVNRRADGLNNDFATITSTSNGTYSINDLRLSLAFQHMLELDARGGTRYTEYLLNHFGIQATDARLDRAEYIGGFRSNINISNVVQSSTGPSSSPLGVLGGVSVSSDVSPKSVNYAATEHGIIMGFIIVRPQVNYSQGLDRKFTRIEKFDYYDPLLANIGEQPIYKYELYLDAPENSRPTTNHQIFGYNEAWADLRYSNNKMSGYMSVNSTLSLASLYSYTENYANAPTLNPEWMISDPNIIGRTLLLNTNKIEYIHQFLGDFYFNYIATRKMPVFSIPGLRKV